MNNQLTRRYLFAGLGAFFASWLFMSARQLWEIRSYPANACATSMKITYVALKHLPPGVDRNHVLAPLKRTMFVGFVPTQDEDTYLSGGHVSDSPPSPELQVQWALLCVEDPRFPVKRMMSRSETLDFEPSYQLFPDRDTVVYCPFHHQAILTNGDVVSR